MNTILLSIVIPAYNAINFIDSSLKSLIDQKTDGVEILLIDDGSTDTTYDHIVSNFKDSISSGFLCVFRQTNQGVSAARNFGISKSKGAYIGFMDADDFVLPGYFEKLLSAIKSGADIIEFGFKTFRYNHSEVNEVKPLYSSKLFGLSNCNQIINKIYGTSRWHPWSRVYKTKLFDDIEFPVGVRFCEDLMVVPLLYEKASTIFNIENALYGYRLNSSGATLNVRPDYIGNLLKFYETIPKSGLIRHDYLRMATSFAIDSCNAKTRKDLVQFVNLKSDFIHLRYSTSTYFDCGSRLIMTQLYPSLFELIKKLKNVISDRK